MSQDQREERQLPSRTIAEAIRNQIESGELPPGAQLPSERDLANAYGTARNTAREAVRILSDAGLVITDQGKGSFVRPQMSLIRLATTGTRHGTGTPGCRRSCWNAPSRAKRAGSKY